MYARSMVGFGVDINAPQMPYVTSTILVKRPAMKIYSFVCDVFGWDDGTIKGYWTANGFVQTGGPGFAKGFKGSQHAWRPPMSERGVGEDEYI